MKGKRNKPGTSKSQERLSPFFPRTTAPKAFFSPATLQPQLTIGQPGDRYEQEADAMGDRVARMSDTPQPAVQEQCADCEQKEALRRQAIPEEDKREEEPTVQAKRELRRQPEKDQEEEPVQTKPDLRRQPEKKEEEEPLQTKPELRRAGEEAGQANLQRQGEEEKREDEPLQTKPLMRKSEAGPSVATPELTNRLNQSKGGGRALPANTQRFMGRAFDADFSGVRVHTDERAAEMNRGLQAKAFTHGGDIYFNRGQYQPDTTEGRRLLGHELTHVVQQEAISTHSKPRIDKHIIQRRVFLELTPAFSHFVGKITGARHCAIVVQAYNKTSRKYELTTFEIAGRSNIPSQKGESRKTISGSSGGKGFNIGPREDPGEVNAHNRLRLFWVDYSFNRDKEYIKAGRTTPLGKYKLFSNNCCHWARRVIEKAKSSWPIIKDINLGHNKGNPQVGNREIPNRSIPKPPQYITP